jgi:hypothetical protein
LCDALRTVRAMRDVAFDLASRIVVEHAKRVKLGVVA